MKSIDDMADDFVLQEARRELPNVLRDYERGRLRMAYLAGLSVGIELCANAREKIEADKRAILGEPKEGQGL